MTNTTKTKAKTKPVAATEPCKELLTKAQDWVDKQDIVDYFHLSDRTLQNLRDGNEISWSNIGGKLYYHLPSFVALLEKNMKK
ncbi:MAG: hypothetical protein JO072_00210 [Parafilimonas sp.]|nr:hypothetical protein [Parafilimonas sp.]